MFSRVVAVAAVLTQPFSYVHAFTLSVATMSVNVQKAKLWDMPVSKNGARCRCVYRCSRYKGSGRAGARGPRPSSVKDGLRRQGHSEKKKPYQVRRCGVLR